MWNHKETDSSQASSIYKDDASLKSMKNME